MSQHPYKQTFLFFCQNDEGDIFVNTKEEVDTELKVFEELDEDINFEVFAKIPLSRLTFDTVISDIEWYKPDTTIETKNRAIMAAFQYLANK